VGDQGIDAFVALKMGRGEAVNSSIVKNRNPMWNQELHIPYVTPGMAKRLEIALYDYDLGSANELIATHRIDISKLKEQTNEDSFEPPEGCVPFWVNFYGAPKNISAIVKESKIINRMNTGVTEATNYDGCLLLQVWKKKVREGRVSVDLSSD
jgi:Ca2+-dependent lipid-binding protein